MKFSYAARYAVVLAALSLVSFFLEKTQHARVDRRPAQVLDARNSYRNRAAQIARQSLMHNTIRVRDLRDSTGEKRFLTAGAHQFRTLWVRDFSFASVGEAQIGQEKAVRDSFDAIFSRQREDGLLPRVLDNEDLAWRFLQGLYWKTPLFGYPLRAGFETEHQVLAIDGNALVVWRAAQYVERTGDSEFAHRWFAAARKSLDFLRQNYWLDGLVAKQAPYADWADSVARLGRVAFTNELYIVAEFGLSRWARFLGLSEKSSEAQKNGGAALAEFKKFFLVREKSGRTFVRNFEADDHLSADANFFAVAMGLYPREISSQILQTLRESALWQPYPGRATDPVYPLSSKHENVKSVAIEGYHDEYSWIWLGALAAMAEKRVGNCGGAQEILDRLARRIAMDGTVYEIYEPDGTGDLLPVSRPLYLAEHPFSWSAGMYLEAAGQLCGGRAQ